MLTRGGNVNNHLRRVLYSILMVNMDIFRTYKETQTMHWITKLHILRAVWLGDGSVGKVFAVMASMPRCTVVCVYGP